MEQILDKAKRIRLAIFDVDGVLTDGVLTYGAEGIEVKNFHVHDGQGLKLLQKSGVEIGIITTCKTALTKRRMQDLGITHFYQDQQNKLPAFLDLKQKLQLTDEEIAYMGDDVPDLPLLKRVGLSITVANAPAIIKTYAHWVTANEGGKGAAREVCDLIMTAQGTYQKQLDDFLQR